MFSRQPVCYSSGSDHSRSQRMPLSGTSVGLLIVLIVRKSLSYLLMPPCTQKMRCSMTAAMGMVLKQSTKIFHILVEYLRLPILVYLYTHHKIRIQRWYLYTRDFLAAGRSSKSTWFCNIVAAPSFTLIVFPDRRSLLGRDSYWVADSHSFWIFWGGRWIVRVCFRLLWWVPWVRVVLVERGRCFWQCCR